MQAYKISVPDTTNSIELRLKLLQVMRKLSIESLNCNWSGTLQNALVDRAGSPVSYDVFLIEVVSNPHNVLK